MTPCEKLGYKVGDKFEMLRSSCGFKKGQVVTLFRDDRTVAPCFKGDNTEYNNAGGEPGAYIYLSNVKPVSQRLTKPISKSKRQLAQLLIEAGVTQFPRGAESAAQCRRDGAISFYGDKPCRDGDCWWGEHLDRDDVIVDVLIPNWHQTVLSRDEFDQIVAETAEENLDLDRYVKDYPMPVGDDETNLAAKEELEALEYTAAPTLDQLLQDWRNADDYAQRKQTEADQAAAMRDERWRAVQARAGEMGVTVGRCESVVVDEPELVITDWRDLQVGDEVECVKYDEPYRFGRVVKIDTRAKSQQIGVRHPNNEISWPATWRFIRRP